MKRIHIFMRKSRKYGNNSIERMFGALVPYFKDNNLDIIIKRCPVESKGLIKRVFLVIWASLNQGDINHISGDINFISIFQRKKKTITTILDNYSYFRLKDLNKYLFKIFWILLPYFKSSNIHFISPTIKRETEKILKKNIKSFSIIPCCIPQKLKFKKKITFQNNLLFIGSGENKNLICLLKAVKNMNINLNIVGEIDVMNKKFLLRNNIKFNNYINLTDEEICKVYHNSDILIFPSLYEGFGMPIIEANHLGLPVITSNLSPMRDISKKSSLLFDPKKPIQLKEKINLIINNSYLRKKLISNGRINAKKYQPQIIAKKFVGLYKELIKKNNL
jgi:glycosyltransferase involved in cell wall biosynthesis